MPRKERLEWQCPMCGYWTNRPDHRHVLLDERMPTFAELSQMTPQKCEPLKTVDVRAPKDLSEWRVAP